MTVDFKKVRVFILPGHTDMRKSSGSLAVLVDREMKHDPFSGSLFGFCNRKRNLLKFVYWELNGFCLWQKRLEKQKFPWPQDGAEAAEITKEELDWLLVGIDFWHRHQRMNFSKII
jgi:transposase